MGRRAAYGSQARRKAMELAKKGRPTPTELPLLYKVLVPPI
jgi:hypothetical protein